MELAAADLHSLGLCLEGFLFGLYSGIFALYLRYNAYKTRTNGINIIVYPHCALYLLSAAVITLDIVKDQVFTGDIRMVYHLENTSPSAAVFACCDLIAQSIIIHRCWLVWGRNIWIVIIPSLLAIAYLVMWMATIGAEFIVPSHGTDKTFWSQLILTSLTESMIVNAVMTGLIAFRIFNIFRVHGVSRSEQRSLGVTCGRKLRSVIFIIIETQMALFAIQLTRLAITISPWTDSELLSGVFDIIVRVHKMLNGITPTILVVRVLTTSHFDEPDELSSISEWEIGSLRFSIDPDDSVPIPEMLNTGQEKADDDIDKSDELEATDS